MKDVRKRVPQRHIITGERAGYDLIVLLDEIYCIVLKDRKRNFICGGLAQLEERVLCKHEVIGSSPIFSIRGLIAQLVRAHA